MKISWFTLLLGFVFITVTAAISISAAVASTITISTPIVTFSLRRLWSLAVMISVVAVGTR
ncbi:MAG: hypothetical protein ABI986_01770, partial [Chloroflexota bacterium]